MQKKVVQNKTFKVTMSIIPFFSRQKLSERSLDGAV